MDWKEIYNEKLCEPYEAVKVVDSGDKVYIGFTSSVAYALVDVLAERKDELEDVTLIGATLNRPMKIFEPPYLGHFKSISTFVGNSERKLVRTDYGDFVSIGLSELENWYLGANLDVAFFEVSPPDENGYMCYGASGIAQHDGIKKGFKKIVLQENKNAPYIYGKDNLIHVSEADCITKIDDELLTAPQVVDDISRQIAKGVMELIPDGAVIQLGIGSVSNAVGYGLRVKNDLGVHTEMYTESMMVLQKEGNITNRLKNINNGISIAAFALGSKELYKYVDHNKDLYFMPYTYTNDPGVIAQNDNMISVNTAMAVNIYGEVAADSIGIRQQSGVGGQLEFVRGSQMSRGGKSIIAINSTRKGKNGPESRIVISFPRFTAVTTPRADVQYVATEYGCVNLKRLTMKERAKALISIAHPDFRSELEAEAKEYHLI